MTNVTEAVRYLRKQGIEAVERAGILVVPASSPLEVLDLVGVVKRYLKEINYDKSWLIDPYFYDVRMKGDRDYEFIKE